MARDPAAADHPDETSIVLDGAFRLVLVLGAVLLLLLVASMVRQTSDPAITFVYARPTGAPAIELIDPDGRSFSLASLRGQPVLVFFGYTHCPDVCPATISTVGEVMDSYGPRLKAVYVTIDPERDTTAWLKDYSRYLRPGFVALTGSGPAIRATASAWGVRYARVDTGGAGGYAMSHTADVYLVDAAGILRAHFPFGTEAAAMAATVHRLTAEPMVGTPRATQPAPSPAMSSASPPKAADLGVEIRSSSVWAGGASPVILALSDPDGRLDDPTIRVTAQLLGPDGAASGLPAEATAVRPPGVAEVSFVVPIAIPTPGSWRLAVTADLGTRIGAGVADVTALDPGTTAVLGGHAPAAHTPTIDDVGGDVRAVTTDPAPDLRLSRQSTSDALAAHRPFVLIVDSPRFRVSPACGRAVKLGRYMMDRWRDVTFIHLEPLRYEVVTDTPRLEGTLEDPRLTPVAEAWGIGGSPWGARSMPWIFVVDGVGTVRAKYEGVIGSEDVDVILSLLADGR